MEKRYLHKDGHVFWGLTNVSLVRDPQGQPVQYVGQVQDITERKRSEEAIASYNKRLQILHQIDSALDRQEKTRRRLLPRRCRWCGICSVSAAPS